MPKFQYRQGNPVLALHQQLLKLKKMRKKLKKKIRKLEYEVMDKCNHRDKCNKMMLDKVTGECVICGYNFSFG